ncbi:coiled-coil domain-containing protein 150 [Hyalella azteca]|uniref:Coiled-coil domain-containing protein 150 n=1 Tax=Hyalella azteca TaxID=294128 RepID=A0A8B7NY03_HYAAZ|nr:coiled-coil domain-containing protein 150 [Hyalella azteca]
MDTPRKLILPSYQTKSLKKITSKHPKGRTSAYGKLCTPAKKVEKTRRITQKPVPDESISRVGIIRSAKDALNLGKQRTPSNPLDVAFDANHEIILSYEQHIAQQDDLLCQLCKRIERLESAHASILPVAELEELQTESRDLRAALTDAETAIHGERRLVSALHHDNTSLKLQLLQSSQRLAAIQILSGVSDERIVALQGSEIVRQKMPDKLRQLQQKLWSKADANAAAGKVNPEEVLVLRHELQSLQESMTLSEKAWAEERTCLIEDKELREQERDLEDARLKGWVKKAEERLAECQRECRASGAQCASLTKELQLQQRQHLKDKTALLSALAKIGGPERLEKELEALNISSSCMDAAVGHVSATCQARQLKLLSLQLQRELCEHSELLAVSERRCEALERETCHLRQARQEAVIQLKKERTAARERQEVLEEHHQKDLHRLKIEVQGIHADLNAVQTDLKKLVLMIYKLLMWQSDSCPPDAVPPSPPAWLDGPRAVTSLARRLQAAIDATRGRLAALKQPAAHTPD